MTDNNQKTLKLESKQEKLICSICRLPILKKPGKGNKPYVVRSVEPIICNLCSLSLYISSSRRQPFEEQDKLEMIFDFDGVEELLNISSEISNFSYKVIVPFSMRYLQSFADDEEACVIYLADCLEEVNLIEINELENDQMAELASEAVFGNQKIEIFDHKNNSVKKNLNQIIKSVEEVIKGQDDKIKQIATSIYRNLRINGNKELKTNLIIMGESGSGKTKIIELLAKEFNVPYVVEDATRYTEAGYVGASVEDMVSRLYLVAKNNIEATERGIIIIDEMDKKKGSGGKGRDVSGESVQNSLLTMIEGTTVPITGQRKEEIIGYVDTSNITFIVIGAFPGMDKIKKERINKKTTLGFGTEEKIKSSETLELTSDDFVKFGFLKEFVGRFDSLIELNSLTSEDMSNIILYSSESSFLHHVRALVSEGIKVIPNADDEIVQAIADEAMKLKIGARGIKRVCNNMFQDIMHEILTTEKKYTKCYISSETVTNSKKYKLK